MAMFEKQMFDIINRNHDCRALAERLNAISARRKKKKPLTHSVRGFRSGWIRTGNGM